MMDHQQLDQVIDNMEEVLQKNGYAPGSSTALVPMDASVTKIIDDAVQLNNDLMAVIEERIKFWHEEKEAMNEFAEWLAKASQKTAMELNKKINKDFKLAKTISDAVQAHKQEEIDVQV